MDNKKQPNFSKQANSKSSQSAESSRKSTDLQSNKAWPRNSCRRENPSASKNDQQRSSKQQQQSATKLRPNVDKRPRPRGYGAGGANGGGGYYAAELSSNDGFTTAASAGLALNENASSFGGAAGALNFEWDSVYAHSSKKQNLNHLLNFHYAPRESDNSMGINVFGRGGNSSHGMSRHGYGKKNKFNKEHFMQANFQFVIKCSALPKLSTSPDTLIDWKLIEQINIQTTEEPQCPICLYPPIAAKLTRCGHAYCWPCILHYLAFTDKTWRKCPICYEAIHTADLKSTTIVQQQPVNVGNDITFHLMRRQKGCMYIEKFQSAAVPTLERYPFCSADDEGKLFSKFLIASRADILDIIEREQRELMTDEDATCPDFVFIQQALDLLQERREKLNNIDVKELPKLEQHVTAAVAEMSLSDEPENKNVKKDGAFVEEAVDTLFPTDDNPLLQKLQIPPTKYYYFYQSVDGQNIYLHPLNVKMLQVCYGALDCAPLIINARILQKEYHSMDEDRRRKFTCLGHLPLTCQFAIVEVNLQPPLITKSIFKLFKDDILFRQKERQRRDREESKREKQIDKINDRQMGKLIASTTNLNLGSSHEFPTFGFVELLDSTSNTQDPCENRRSAAISTPKRPISTYSSVAVVGDSPTFDFGSWASPTTNTFNSYQELSTNWRSKRDLLNQATATTPPCDKDSDTLLSPIATNLGDVLAKAFSQKKQGVAEENNGTAGGGKKNKKTKKMLPLFSTGMNYNGK